MISLDFLKSSFNGNDDFHEILFRATMGENIYFFTSYESHNGNIQFSSEIFSNTSVVSLLSTLESFVEKTETRFLYK